MGKATGIIKELSGKIGPLIFQQRKNGKTAVYLAPEDLDTPLRTKLQMLTTLVWANLGALYSMFNKTLRHSHENLPDGRSDYNQFLSDNCKMVKVYLTKTDKQNGACILCPVLISRGKLPSIYYEPNSDGILVTDLKLGDLVINENTTVGEFTAAVMNHNEEWDEDHQLTMFYGRQLIDRSTLTPRARIYGYKLKLDLSSDTLLWSLVTPLGFSSVATDDGYVLGMDRAIVEGAAAWVHTYEDVENGILRVSTQRMVVDSSVLESYMSDAAFEASVASYGGITNTKKAFLRPDEETNLVGVVYTSGGNGSGSNGANGSNGGNTSGGNGGSSQGGGTNTGGDSGNSGTGNVTPSTPKLTISRSGTGTSTVSVNGEGVSSGAEIAGGTEVTVSVTPAEGATPTASLNGNTVTLTESDGVYTGTFSMPSANATLVINSGGTTGGGSGDMN